MHNRLSPRAGPFAALAVPLFRALWLAEFAGDLGNWIQTVGAQWVIVDRSDAALLAAAVLAASRGPTLLFALPMGVLADMVDRRRLLLGGQAFQAAVAGLVAYLSAVHRLGPPALIALTFLLGTGSALSVVAYQAMTPQLVPEAVLPSAVAVAQVNLNLARVLGPPVGGLLVATAGPTPVFVLDALSYLAFVAVLLARWSQFSPQWTHAVRRPRPRLLGTLAEGLAYIRRSGPVRRILLHTLLVTGPSSALWALLPSTSVHRLHLGATGYGLLLAALGAGSVAAAASMPWLYRRLRVDALLLGAGLTTAAAQAALGLTGNRVAAAAALTVFGAAWLAVQTLLGSSMLLACPDRVRARALGLFQSIRIGGQGLGALAWGALAGHAGLRCAMLLAAAGMAVAALSLLRFPLRGRD
jgi:predicted MFS family arabinose efflux permease